MILTSFISGDIRYNCWFLTYSQYILQTLPYSCCVYSRKIYIHMYHSGCLDSKEFFLLLTCPQGSQGVSEFTFFFTNKTFFFALILLPKDTSWVSNIESDNSQNVGLEDYNNISVGIFPYFTTPSIKITLG